MDVSLSLLLLLFTIIRSYSPSGLPDANRLAGSFIGSLVGELAEEILGRRAGSSSPSIGQDEFILK